MRYEAIDTVPFTTIDGKTNNIKDIREYEILEILSFLNLRGEDLIDEIATREEFYGSGSEFDSYKIVDQNIVILFDNDFNLSKIKKLGIPS